MNTPTHSAPSTASGHTLMASLPFISIACLAFSLRSIDFYWLGLLLLLAWSGYAAQQRQYPFTLNTRLLSAVVALLVVYWLGRAVAGFWGVFDYADLVKGGYDVLVLAAVPLAFALKRCQPFVQWLLLLPALATAIRLFVYLDYDQPFQVLYSGGVNGFGRFHITFGLYASFGLLCTLAAYSFREQVSAGIQRRVFVGCVWVLAFIMVQGVISSGSRSNWLALLVAIGLMLIPHVLRLKSTLKSVQQALKQPNNAIIFSLLLLGGLGFVWVNMSGIFLRISGELQTGLTYLFNPELIPKDQDVFVGTRLQMYAQGLEWFEQRFWWGHGWGSVAPLLAEDRYLFDHHSFHNRLVDMLVVNGALGTAIVLLLPASLLFWRYRQGQRLGQRSAMSWLVIPLCGFVFVQSLFWSSPYHYGNVLITQFMLAFIGFDALSASGAASGKDAGEDTDTPRKHGESMGA